MCRMWRDPDNSTLWTDVVHSSVMVMLFKKGERTDPGNYRGISLLSIISRIIARILARRITKHAEEEKLYDEFQWAFRKGRSCRDVILIIRLLFEQFTSAEKRYVCATRKPAATEAQQDQRDKWKAALEESRILLTMVDIKKAYPSTCRTKLWRTLERAGIPPHACRLLRDLHSQTQYTIKTNLGEAEPFLMARGVREGCPSSCCIFNLYHGVALKAIDESLKGIQLVEAPDYTLFPNENVNGQEWKLAALGFADDTNGLTSKQEGDEALQAMDSLISYHRAELHPNKTERLVARYGPPPADEPPMYTGKAARVLGGWVNADGSNETDTAKRLQSAKIIWEKCG